MGRITLRQAAAWVGGTIDPKYADVTFLGAEYDSRNLQPGQLFVAVRAARDGHDFIPAALEKGAAAVLCDHCDGDYPAIVVDDTRIALGVLARQELKRLGVKVVAVTGSVGKSTTKEMIVSVLQTQLLVAKTPANRNNDLGMPAAILGMPDGAQVAVLEMGMSHFGEIAYLTKIGCPDVAVIINVGTMHMENLGSREGILQAKLEILQGLKEGGALLINGDNDLLWASRDSLPVKPVCFGQQAQSAFRAEAITRQPGQLCYQAVCPDSEFAVQLPLEGDHYISDSLAAISAGKLLGIRDENIQLGLATFRTMAGRQEIYRAEGYTIISDCYNAGPESMAAALKVLGNRPGRKIAVLGDMLELGDFAPQAHHQVGLTAAQNADIVLALGPNATFVRQGALEGGLAPQRIHISLEAAELTRLLKELAENEDVILFKGSRGMRMERILEGFLQKKE